MRKKTWEQEGIEYAAELAEQNFRDLRAILEWNREHGIELYRCSSGLVPWNSQFALSELPNYDRIEQIATECGDLIEDAGMRLTFHPDHWCKLASESADTIERSVESVSHHGRWLDLLGLERSPRHAINVHIGAHYGDKEATAQRFCGVIEELPPRARDRLVVENDDKRSLWSVAELVDSVAEDVGIPVTFDYHHHKFTDRGRSFEDAFELASGTWDRRPISHYSESAKLHGDSAARPQDHAEFVADIPAWLRRRSDVMIEAHGKEETILRFDPQRWG